MEEVRWWIRSDSHFDGDGLSLEEIREALDHSVMADKAFDFVAFDACLMGSVEIADCLEEGAGYVIASPELEPQDGYDYSWMTALGDSLPSDMEWGRGRPVSWWRPMVPTMPQVLRLLP